jgi:hypothetical protein
MGNTIATPPQFYRAEKTPADADHEFSKKNQKNRRKNSDDYNNNHDDDDERKTISMSTERKKKRERVYSSNNNNNIKPRLIPRPKLEEFVDNNMGSEKSVLIQQLRETFNLDLRQAHNQYYNHIKPILASLDKSSYQLQDDDLESPISSEWTDDDDVIKESTSKKKSKICHFRHEIEQLSDTDMVLMVAPENKQCRSEGCTKYKKSSYHDGYCLSCYREHNDLNATSIAAACCVGIDNHPIPLPGERTTTNGVPLQINWIAIPEKFEQNCNALREFLILRQKLPSNNSEDKNEKKLYTFINNQRHQQQQNNLDPAREALLNSINRGILAYRREYVPSEEGREIEQAGDVPEEEHTTGDNSNNGSTEDNVAAIKTEYEADTDDDTPTVNKTDRKDLKVKIKSEY